MKKTILAIMAVVCFVGGVSAQHKEFKWRGFYGVMDLSYGFNINRALKLNGAADTASMLGLTFSSGFQFFKETGVGIGVSYLHDGSGAYTQLPIFVELRSNFLRSRITPYGVAQVGYSLPLGTASESPIMQIMEGGLYVGLEAGARYAIERTLAVSAHVGYKLLQSNKFKRFEPGNPLLPYLEDPIVLDMLFVGVGFHF